MEVLMEQHLDKKMIFRCYVWLRDGKGLSLGFPWSFTDCKLNIPYMKHMALVRWCAWDFFPIETCQADSCETSIDWSKHGPFHGKKVLPEKFWLDPVAILMKSMGIPSIPASQTGNWGYISYIRYPQIYGLYPRCVPHGAGIFTYIESPKMSQIPNVVKYSSTMGCIWVW